MKPLRTLLILLPVLLLAPALTGCIFSGGVTCQGPACRPTVPAPAGNAEAYGVVVINLEVEKDDTSGEQFVFDPDPVPGTSYEVTTSPENGNLLLPAGLDLLRGALHLIQATYVPDQGFIGLDFFSFSINRPDGSGFDVSGYVDVRACMRLPFKREEKNLHVAAMSGFPRGTTTVHVSNTPEDLNIALSSQHPRDWVFEVEPGATIESVVIHYDPHFGAGTVTGISPAKVSYIQGEAFEYEWQSDVSANFFSFFIEEIRDHFNANEEAFQGCDNPSRITVPFTPESLTVSCGDQSSHYTLKDQDCNFRCGSAGTDPAFSVLGTDVTNPENFHSSNITLSNGNLTAEESDGKAVSYARAAETRSCGRYYWEVTVVDEGGGASIGMARAATSNWDDIVAGVVDPLNPLPPDCKQGMQASSLVDFAVETGDVIGVAADLETGRVFYRKNGAWLFGADPTTGFGGKPLDLAFYEPVSPAVCATDGARLTLNFGQSDFEGVVPDGYQPALDPPDETLLTGPPPVPPDPPSPLEDPPFCFRPDQVQGVDGNLHIVSIAFTPSPTFGPMTVHVNDTGGPMSLILASEIHIPWELIVDPQADLVSVRVVAPGDAPAEVDGVPPEIITEVEGSSPEFWEPGNDNLFFGLWINFFRSALLLDETTFQACSVATEATVPPTPASLVSFCNGSSSYNFADQACPACAETADTGATLDPGRRSELAKVTNDGLTLAVDGTVGSAQRALSGSSHACGGKYYFEVNVDTYTSGGNTGVGFSFRNIDLNQGNGLLRIFGTDPQTLWPAAAPGDTLMVAIDFDNNVAYFGRDGTWLVGDPVAQTDGVSLGLYTYDPLHVGITVQPGDQLTLNFGTGGFAFGPPALFSGGY